MSPDLVLSAQQSLRDLAIVIPPSRRKRELPSDSPSIPARDLYLGRQHGAMVSSIDALRQARPDISIALYIVSSLHGLLTEHQLVVPYTGTLGFSPRQWHETGDHLHLHERLCQPLYEARYVLYCLSTAHLTAARAPFEGPGTAVYLAAPNALPHADVTLIPAGRHEARALGVSERDVRARVLRALCASIVEEGMRALELRVIEHGTSRIHAAGKASQLSRQSAYPLSRP